MFFLQLHVFLMFASANLYKPTVVYRQSQQENNVDRFCLFLRIYKSKCILRNGLAVRTWRVSLQFRSVHILFSNCDILRGFGRPLPASVAEFESLPNVVLR